MKIIQSLDKIVKGKRYYKYRINLPKRTVEQTGLDQCTVAVMVINDNVLIYNADKYIKKNGILQLIK